MTVQIVQNLHEASHTHTRSLGPETFLNHIIRKYDRAPIQCRITGFIIEPLACPGAASAQRGIWAAARIARLLLALARAEKMAL